MHESIRERTLLVGQSIVDTQQTVRMIAKQFGISKSTVHKDLTERLPLIHAEMASQVKEILEYHKAIRHLRGGEATKKKYQKTNLVFSHASPHDVEQKEEVSIEKT